MKTRIRNHDLEETVFHESVHATLDAKHASSQEWLAAQQADDAFITTYASRNPAKEDLAESALFALTMQKHPGRLPVEVEQWAGRHIPNRLVFFRGLFATPKQDKPGQAKILP